MATPDERLGLLMLAVAIGMLCIVTINALRHGGPFGYDESVYSVKAWSLAEPGRVHAVYWNAYRAPGFPAMLSSVFRVHRGVFTARLVVVALGAMTVVCTWAIGRRMVSPVVGGVAALLTAVTPTFTTASSFVLVDVPGVAFSMLAILLFLPVLQGRISWWRVAAVVLTCWVATCVRFGAPFCFGFGLAIIGGRAVLSARRQRDRVWAVRTVAAVAGAAAGVPLLYMSPLFGYNGLTPMQANDALIESKGMTMRTGLRSLLDWVDHDIVGDTGTLVFTLLTLAFVVAGLVLSVRRPSLRFPAGCFAACAALSALAVAAVVGQVVFNYLVVAIPFLALTAAIGAVAVAEAVPWRRTVVALAAALTLVGGLVAADRTEAAQRASARSLVELERSADAITARLGDRCMVVTKYSPQITWMTECATVTFPAVPTVADAAHASWLAWQDVSDDADPTRVAMLTFENRTRQPTEEDLAASSALYAATIYRTPPSSHRRPATVVLFEECAALGTCTAP